MRRVRTERTGLTEWVVLLQEARALRAASARVAREERQARQDQREKRVREAQLVLQVLREQQDRLEALSSDLPAPREIQGQTALSDHKDHKDHREIQGRLDHRDRRVPQD